MKPTHLLRHAGRALSLIVALALAAPAVAGPGLDQLHHFLKTTRTLKTQFDQSVLDKNHAQANQGQGTFYLQRPSRFRWDYDHPAQQIIADGNRVWSVDKGLKQVAHQSQATALAGTPALFLSSSEPLEKDFEVVELAPRDGLAWLELIPRDDESQFVRVLLAFANNVLQRMEMSDKLGQVTRFQFSNQEINPVLDPETFRFTPPPAYDILGQE